MQKIEFGPDTVKVDTNGQLHLDAEEYALIILDRKLISAAAHNPAISCIAAMYVGTKQECEQERKNWPAFLYETHIEH